MCSLIINFTYSEVSNQMGQAFRNVKITIFVLHNRRAVGKINGKLSEITLVRSFVGTLFQASSTCTQERRGTDDF